MGRPNTSALSEIALTWLDADPRARVMVGPMLVVEWINAAAARLMTPGAGMTVQGGKLHFARPADEVRVRAFIAAATDTVTSLALPARDTADHLLLRCRRIVPGGEGLVCIDIVADRPEGAANADQLSAMFGLTASETRVAQALLEGLSVADVARERGLSVDTVRTHVRGIYAKTGSASREQFFRRVMPFYYL